MIYYVKFYLSGVSMVEKDCICNICFGFFCCSMDVKEKAVAYHFYVLRQLFYV